MTLKEAHELQRRELISLRAKVARLEKQTTGLFLVEEKEALERHIRHLEQVNKTESRRHEEARAHWKLMESLIFDLELELLDVKEQLEVALSENEQLRLRAEKAEAEVAMLNGTNAKLQKKLNTNFENSSLPSSALSFRKKVPNNRKPSGKKPGAQKGHKAHTTTKLTATKEPIIIPAPDSFASNPDLYPTGKKITKQCISDITKGIVNISTGTIYNLSEEFSASTETERAKIFSLLTHSDVLYSDATVSNINGKRKAVILCTNKEQVLYQHTDHKGHDGLSKTPVKNFEGTVVHEHDKTYYSYGSSHQECLAHVLRYLIGAIESEPDLKWHKQMHKLLQKMIHTAKKNKSGMPKDKIKALTDKYVSILNLASDEYEKHPPTKDFMNGFNLYKRLRDYQDDHLYFLSHPEIDYTNNISERQLRKFKRKRKQAVVLRSDTGGQHICDALTIIETAKMQNRNVYDTMEAAFIK